jgi:hypothetical protein
MTRSKPSAFASEARPGGGRGKYLSDPLGMQGERTDGHVAMVLRHDHVPHVADLFGGELRWQCSRATGTIVKGAILGELGPSMIAGRGKAQHSESDGERDGLQGMLNSGQDGPLGPGIGNAQGIEPEPGQAHEQKGKPDDGKKEPDFSLEREDLGLEFLLVQCKGLGRDHRTRTAAEPACSRRARHTKVLEQHGVVTLANEVAKSVVIGMTTRRGWHASMSSKKGLWASQRKVNFLCNFTAVAVACTNIQKVLLRSCDAFHRPEI